MLADKTWLLKRWFYLRIRSFAVVNCVSALISGMKHGRIHGELSYRWLWFPLILNCGLERSDLSLEVLRHLYFGIISFWGQFVWRRRLIVTRYHGFIWWCRSLIHFQIMCWLTFPLYLPRYCLASFYCLTMRLFK